jgi:hypothetical protein
MRGMSAHLSRFNLSPLVLPPVFRVAGRLTFLYAAQMSSEPIPISPSLQVPRPQPNTRSELDIVLSCWATVFICAWVSIHPNIPPSGEKPLRALWTRITLMFWALVVPELILAWAVKQWLAARAIEHAFRGICFSVLRMGCDNRKHSPIADHKWTMAHAHFLGMGGFTLVDPGVPEGLEPPDIREIDLLNIPVQPKVPEWNEDPESLDHYSNDVNDYWVNERKRYAEDRKKFWRGWECIQRKCSVYSNFIPKSMRDRNLLLRLGEEDYSRYERYGQTLPPHITYLRESPGTLTFYRFQDLAATSMIHFPSITDEEIRDKSKGDLLSKAVAVLQTTWFIVQCVARPSQGLAITELELATLALASLNAVTYFLWWDKPLDVKEPVKVYFRGAVPVESTQVSFLPLPIPHICNILVQGSLGTLHNQGLLSQILQQISSASVLASIANLFQTQREDMNASNPWTLPFRWFIYFPIASLVESLYAIINTTDIAPGAAYVPKFYATNVNSSNLDNHFMYFVLPIIAIVFGGLHCFGWNFTFPTRAERILWRVMCLLITFIPLVTGLLLLHHGGRRRDQNREQRNEQRSDKVLKTLLLYPALTLLVVYVLARLSLLTQALVLLRRQPPSAYEAVDWSRFLPHISMN